MKRAVLGIRTADGAFYPIMDPAVGGRKRVILTPGRDRQEKAKIVLFEKSEDELENLGTLFLEHIARPEGGRAEIELVVGTDEERNIFATATDPVTGEIRSLSVDASREHRRAVPADEESGGFDDVLVTAVEDEGGEDEPWEGGEHSAAPGRTPAGAPVYTTESFEEAPRGGINPFLLIGFVILGVLVILTVAYFILRETQPVTPASAGAMIHPLELATSGLAVTTQESYRQRRWLS